MHNLLVAEGAAGLFVRAKEFDVLLANDSREKIPSVWRRFEQWNERYHACGEQLVSGARGRRGASRTALPRRAWERGRGDSRGEQLVSGVRGRRGSVEDGITTQSVGTRSR